MFISISLLVVTKAESCLIGSRHVDHICLCFSENPALEKQDTFVEKLVTQVIKNLQVKISNIHVRYEDDVSAFGQGGVT